MKKVIFLLIILIYGIRIAYCTDSWMTFYGNKASSIAKEGNYLWIGNINLLIRFNTLTHHKTIYDLSELGVTERNITSIAIDSSGNKWIGTDGDGIIRYNNSTFIRTDTSNSELPNNYINALAFSADTLLAATNNGLYVHYNNISHVYTDPTSNNHISSIAIDPYNNKWIGTEFGLFVFDNITWRNKVPSSEPFYISPYSITFEADTAWIVYSQNNSAFLKKLSTKNIAAQALQTWQIDTLYPEIQYLGINGILANKDHEKIMTNGRGDILKFNGSQMTILQENISGLYYYPINAIISETDSTFWLGCNGLYYYNGNSIERYNATNSSLKSAYETLNEDGSTDYLTPIQVIRISKSRTAWIGTESGGITRFNGKEWHSYTNKETGLGLMNQHCNAIGFSNDNKVWASVEFVDNRLVQLENNQWDYFGQIGYVMNMEQDNSGVPYLVTRNETLGIYYYQEGNWNKYTTFDFDPAGLNQTDYITDLYIDFTDTDSTIWLGANISTGGNCMGLLKLSNHNSTHYNTLNSPLPDDAITSITKDRSGAIWAATVGGLAKLDGENWTIFTTQNSPIPDGMFDNDWPQVVISDNNNNIWIGTRLSGLMKYNGTDWTVYNTSNSQIPHNDVRTLQVDKFNNLWIGTGNGLCVYNEAGITQLLTDSSVHTYTIRGKVFLDGNGNGNQDAGEPAISHQRVILYPDSVAAYTDMSGNYFFQKGRGSYQVKIEPDNNFAVSTDSSLYHISIVDADTEIDTFGIRPSISFDSITFSISSAIARCNTEVPFWIQYENRGSNVMQGLVYLVADSRCQIIQATPAPAYILGDTLFWQANNLSPFVAKQIKLIVGIPGRDSALGFDSIYFSGSYRSASGRNYPHQVSETIRCSFDPNDKLVYPLGPHKDSLSLLTNPLEYTVRFQNTGNDTAFTVIVRDTLPSDVDLSTFHLTNSSHNVQVSLSGNILVCTFNNILLPDSNTNELLSHGFIKFRINPKPGLTPQTTINNRAAIIFDRNTAIITNNTHTVLVSVIPADLISGAVSNIPTKHVLQIFPNPSNGQFTIRLENNAIIENLQLIDISGKVVYSSNSNSTTVSLNAGQLASGFYLLQVRSDNELFTEKIIIE